MHISFHSELKLFLYEIGNGKQFNVFVKGLKQRKSQKIKMLLLILFGMKEHMEKMCKNIGRVSESENCEVVKNGWEQEITKCSLSDDKF